MDSQRMAKREKERVVLFMPAYYAERTLASLYQKIPKALVDEIIVIDDRSRDRIEQVAERLQIKFYRNRQNLGYGGNSKVCIQKSLELGGDILIELHPDDQYDPSAIPEALAKIQEGYDLVMGSRFLKAGGALAHAMPLWKYLINRFSTLPAQAVLGVKLTDFHSGFRVYKRRFLESVNYQENDNDYLFSFQIIAQACFGGFKIAEVPVTCRYFQDATQISFKKSVRYGWGALKTLHAFRRARRGHVDPIFISRPPADSPQRQPLTTSSPAL